MRTPQQIQEAISDLLAEVVELGKSDEAKGLQGVRYHSTQVAFDLGRAVSGMRKYVAQVAADQRADEQLQAMSAMQAAAGAFTVPPPMAALLQTMEPR